MGKQKGNVNTKVQAGLEKKAANKAIKDKKAKEAADKVLDAEWEVGSNTRAAKRGKEAELKAQEADRKRAEKARLLAEEESSLSSVKTVKKTGKKAAKKMDKPWELHDDTVKKPKKKGFSTGSAGKAAAAAKTSKAGSSSSSSSTDKSIFNAANSAAKGKGLVEDASLLMENNNRAEDVLDGRGLDQALDAISIATGKEGQSVEAGTKNIKAAYMAWEEVQLPIMKEEHPGLKRSQYKDRLSQLWRKAPENPINQVRE